MDDSFLQQSTSSATKHLFILAKIHLLFNLKLLNRSRSLSSSLNMQSTNGPGIQSHPTQLPFPSAAWGCSDPVATAISTVSLLAFSFLPWDVQSPPTAWPFLSNFSIFSYLKKNEAYPHVSLGRHVPFSTRQTTRANFSIAHSSSTSWCVFCTPIIPTKFRNV